MTAPTPEALMRAAKRQILEAANCLTFLKNDCETASDNVRVLLNALNEIQHVEDALSLASLAIREAAKRCACVPAHTMRRRVEFPCDTFESRTSSPALCYCDHEEPCHAASAHPGAALLREP